MSYVFSPQVSSSKHALADVPVEMPLDVLLAIPDYAADDPATPIFNLPGLVARLLGNFGLERATKILNPKIWAPTWTPERIQRFASSPFSDRPELFEGMPASRIAVPDFPGTGALRDLESPDFPQFDVIHFVGMVEWKDGDRALKLSERQDWWAHSPTLYSLLQKARTRLFILQTVARQIADARDLVKPIADLGGSATVLVVGSDPGLLSGYFVDLYADIVHNKSLEDAARPKPWVQQSELQLTVDLYCGQGGSELLRFDRWLEALRQKARELTDRVNNAVPTQSASIEALHSRAEPFVHRSEVDALESRLEVATAQLASMRERIVKANNDLQMTLNWAHERGGAEPLSKIAELVPNLEAAAAQAMDLYPELQTEVEESIRNAPRVLNANFADPNAQRVLDPLEGLVASQEYALLVDIGPRWNTIPTIVRGNAEWPESALPPDASGHLIDIMVVSDDFAPRVVSGKLWLPRNRGRSHAWLEGRPASTKGPIQLRLKAPAIESPQAQRREARARLFLYYQNNLLQSAIVTAGIVREAGVTLDRENRVDVDYALTETFRDVESNFGWRELRLAAEDTVGRHPIRLNITLNSDGQGVHRIFARGLDGLSSAWVTYDPKAAGESLGDARKALRDRFWKRDEVGNFVQDRNGQFELGLDERNGKPLRQFSLDLLDLVRVGSRLYREMIHHLRPESSAEDPVAWEQALRQQLDTSGVIQVARIESAPTQYTFPWTLLYDYPLPGPEERWYWCHVFGEWSKEGIRAKPIARACPYKDEPWHREDVLCPYGFWGLKHIIEQPLAPAMGANGGLRDAVNKIPVKREIVLSMAWTRDSRLKLPYIDAHVQRLSGIRSVRLAGPPPNPADDYDTLRSLLSSPNLVYFICHCMRDPVGNEPYLYVGPHDEKPIRRIYEKTITDWRRTGLGEWRRLRPLVFINGCHTANLEPGEVLNFVSAFSLAGAAGIIATEVSVDLRLAIEIAESLFTKIVATEGGTLGQSMREVRWELANKGNLLGLCYTAYGLSDLRFVRDPSGTGVI